jgi:hypothetical protein
MNKIKITLLLLGFVLVLSSCKDENLAPVLTFEQTQQGGFPRLLNETGGKLINLFDIGGSSYGYTVEFVDLEQGALVTEYRLEMIYNDVNPDNGSSSAGPIVFASYSQGDFTTNAEGYKEITVSIPASAAIAAANTTADALKAGDNFQFKGYVTLSDGNVYGSSNSSASVRGSAFRGHFDFTMPAACPSDLAGSYEYTSTDYWCGGPETSGSVSIQALGGGKYQFNDWSFGTYGVCYGGGGGAGDLNFTDVCAEVSFTGFTDVYGDTWTYDSEINGNEWTINWENTYGECGSAVIKYTGGADWPFTLK